MSSVVLDLVFSGNAEAFTVSVHVARWDITISGPREEIARIYGYDKLPVTLPKR